MTGQVGAIRAHRSARAAQLGWQAQLGWKSAGYPHVCKQRLIRVRLPPKRFTRTPTGMIAIFAGTFDPIHNGHLDIIERAARLFDEVRVAIAQNPSKTPRFPIEQRLALIADSVTAHNVATDTFGGLIVDYASQFDSAVLLRGIRNGADLDYETQMAELNRTMRPDMDTVYLPTAAAVSAISSTYIRQISAMGGDVSAFVPIPVLRALSPPA